MSSLYKYVGPGFIDVIFSNPEVATLKCGYPNEFNDPYELFLTMDFTEEPELLAFYGDVIGKLPQLPTTCFSLSPSVVPMWAHYASNLQGFVLELDEELLKQRFPESAFRDVAYQDGPNADVSGHLHRAYEIGKFRYMHFLQAAVFHAAYFTKQTCWSYEMERRMVVDEEEVAARHNLALIDVPVECIRSIICGPRASQPTVEALRERADAIHCRFLQMQIGRSTGVPYFFGTSGKPMVFGSEGLEQASNWCSECKEPIDSRAEECSWCRIDDQHKLDAMNRNSYRLLHQHGLLDGYLENTVLISTQN